MKLRVWATRRDFLFRNRLPPCRAKGSHCHPGVSTSAANRASFLIPIISRVSFENFFECELGLSKNRSDRLGNSTAGDDKIVKTQVL